MKELPYQARAIIGRREMVTLSQLSMTLCCKVDTGAQTSVLHAENIETFENAEGVMQVRFETFQGDADAPLKAIELPLHDRRRVISFNGQGEWRCVIKTPLVMGELAFDVELILTDRRAMRHPMLLGRRAMRRLLVAPGVDFLHGEP